MPENTNQNNGLNIDQLLNALSGLFGSSGGGGGGGFGSGLLGAGLLGSSLLGRDESGRATEAFQFLRNRLGAEGLPSQFSNLVTSDAFTNQFEPFLQQQERQALDQAQQRILAGRPTRSSTAISGPEVSSLLGTAEDILIPRRQAFIGDLGLGLLGLQNQAASQIIQGERPDALSQALGTLGGILLANQFGGGGGLLGGSGGGGGLLDIFGGGGGQSNNPISSIAQDILSNIIGGNTSGQSLVGALTSPIGLFAGGNSLQAGLGLIPGAAQGLFPTLSSAAGQTFTSSVSSVLGGASIGGFEAAGGGAVNVLGEGGSILGTVFADGGVVNAAGEAVGSVASGGAASGGMAATLGTLLQGLGVGVGSGFLGHLIGSQIPDSQLLGSLAGGAGGAAAGAILGSIFPGIGTAIGALIGGLAGGGGGFFGSRGSSHEQQEANRIADSNSQASQVRAVADFWLSRIDSIGGNTQQFMNQVTQNIRNIDSPADEQSMTASLLGSAFLQEAQRFDDRIQTIDEIPGLREQFLSFMAENAWVEPRAGERAPLAVGTAGESMLRTLASASGFAPFAHGGHVNRPTLALVGEQGPEVGLLMPGSTIMPIQKSGGLLDAVNSRNARPAPIPR